MSIQPVWALSNKKEYFDFKYSNFKFEKSDSISAESNTQGMEIKVDIQIYKWIPFGPLILEYYLHLCDTVYLKAYINNVNHIYFSNFFKKRMFIFALYPPFKAFILIILLSSFLCFITVRMGKGSRGEVGGRGVGEWCWEGGEWGEW